MTQAMAILMVLLFLMWCRGFNGVWGSWFGGFGFFLFPQFLVSSPEKHRIFEIICHPNQTVRHNIVTT